LRPYHAIIAKYAVSERQQQQQQRGERKDQLCGDADANQSLNEQSINQSINQHCSNTTTLCNQQQQQQTEEKRDQSCCDADDTDGCVGRLCDVKQVIEQSLIVVLSKQLKLVQNKHH